jgi:D-xylose transport system substrate-binding protein
MEQILVGAENDVDAVFAANDGIANSVIGALENAGIDPTTIPVSGQDATVAGHPEHAARQADDERLQADRREAAVGAQAALALRAGEDVTSLTGDFEIIGIDAEGKPTDEARPAWCRTSR